MEFTTLEENRTLQNDSKTEDPRILARFYLMYKIGELEAKQNYNFYYQHNML